MTFTATVSVVTGVGSPTGTVQFFNGAGLLGSSPLSTSGSATFATSSLVAGLHAVTVVYSGDGNFTGSNSAALSQNVLRKTTTVVTSNRTPTANLGQNITFTATVRPVTGAGFPTTGAVQFNIDNANVGAPVTLNAQGRATFSTATLTAGSHNVFATYNGTTVFAGSTSVVIVQIVNQAATTTTVTSNVNPSVFGQNVTLTARVQPNPGAGAIVVFSEGFLNLGSSPLDATGRARLTINTFGVGIHAVTAFYPGSVNYMASTSAVFNQTVNKANSRTVVTTSGTPATSGTNVVFTATVTAVAPGVGVPRGMVQFRIDGLDVGVPVALNTSRQATYATSTLTVGLHTVSAVYAGDGNFNGSTSASINQRIR